MTRKYDEAFAEAKAENGLLWYPWVGDNYHSTRILVLGHTTAWNNTSSQISRRLVAWEGNTKSGEKLFDYENVNSDKAQSFRGFTSMLVDANAGSHDEVLHKRAQLWRSVAFNNFCQCPVDDIYEPCPCEDQSLRAYNKVLDILDPNLILGWGVRVMDYITKDYKTLSHIKIGDASPRMAIVDRFPVVCIRHPSQGFSPEDWLAFLRGNELSAGPVDCLIDQLNTTS